MTALAGNLGNDAPSYRDILADQKADTRKRILDSARRVFLASGYDDANLNEIARGAGVGKGTLYRHFESKGELYVAMLSRHGGVLARELADVIDAETPVPKQLEKLAHFYLDFWQRNPEHFQIVRAVQNQPAVGPLTPELMLHVRGIFEAPLRLLESLLRRGIELGQIRPIDPWNAANALALACNAVIGPIVLGAPPIVERDFAVVYRQLVEMLLAGLEASEGD